MMCFYFHMLQAVTCTDCLWPLRRSLHILRMTGIDSYAHMRGLMRCLAYLLRYTDGPSSKPSSALTNLCYASLC